MQVAHLEDYRANDSRFEHRYEAVSEEQAYAEIDRFVMPSTVTEEEKRIVALLVAGYEQAEVAATLGISKTVVAARLRTLRVKLADWKVSPSEVAPVDGHPEVPVAPAAINAAVAV